MCNKDVEGGIRDGVPNDINDAATDTISDTTDSNPRYSRHEGRDYYKKCETRRRNAGLYIADRNIATNSPATRTRQNENGDRYGWECPEERDYYPYWHPTPWRDIAIITYNTSMCDFYRANSQNVVDKGECQTSATNPAPMVYNNENECKSNNGFWKVYGKWDLPAPECIPAETVMSQDNHLGNSITGDFATYWWNVPDLPGNTDADPESCVLRVRYNITTAEYNPFWTFSTSNGNSAPVKQDPFVNTQQTFPSELSIALNTNQYGRTFQDRSYVFNIKPRPSYLAWWSTIWNLNVMGKRGNIVDTYPSVEYQFIPKQLVLPGGDVLHIQWTGSDYNPNRNPNNAEGGPVDPQDGASTRADRTNIVQIDGPNVNVPRNFNRHTMFMTHSGATDTPLVTRLAYIDQPIESTTECRTYEQLAAELGNNQAAIERDRRNCGKLNNAPGGPYFDGGLVILRTNGNFWYMSSRNNNFSNRSQKGNLIVYGGWFNAANSIAMPFVAMLVSALATLFFML